MERRHELPQLARGALLAGFCIVSGCTAEHKPHVSADQNPAPICRPGPYSEADVRNLGLFSVGAFGRKPSVREIVQVAGRNGDNPYCGPGTHTECDCSSREFESAVKNLLGPYGVLVTWTGGDALRLEIAGRIIHHPPFARSNTDSEKRRAALER